MAPNTPEVFLMLLSPLQTWGIPRFPSHGVSAPPSSPSTSPGRNFGAAPAQELFAPRWVLMLWFNPRGFQGQEKGWKEKQATPKHKYFLTLLSENWASGKDLEEPAWCLHCSEFIHNSGGVSVDKRRNFAVEKDLCSEGKSLFCTDTCTWFLVQVLSCSQAFAALYQSGLIKVEFISHLSWILCQFVWNSTNVNFFHVSQVFCPFFFLPEMDPCSEFSWSTAKSTSILYFQPVHEWFLLGFFSCFDSSLQSLETQNIWIKIPYSDAMLVVNFVRFG